MSPGLRPGRALVRRDATCRRTGGAGRGGHGPPVRHAVTGPFGRALLRGVAERGPDAASGREPPRRNQLLLWRRLPDPAAEGRGFEVGVAGRRSSGLVWSVPTRHGSVAACGQPPRGVTKRRRPEADRRLTRRPTRAPGRAPLPLRRRRRGGRLRRASGPPGLRASGNPGLQTSTSGNDHGPRARARGPWSFSEVEVSRRWRVGGRCRSRVPRGPVRPRCSTRRCRVRPS